jgi:hypothetical protein
VITPFIEDEAAFTASAYHVHAAVPQFRGVDLVEIGGKNEIYLHVAQLFAANLHIFL